MNNNFDFSLEPGKNLNKISYADYKRVISIITPTFNTTEVIFQTANSILNQTYPCFEWLIIDDGSTEKDSLELLSKLESLDDRIKVFHKKNEGPGIARDYGVEKSSKESKYIVFLDQDDLMDNTFLETAYYSMCTYNEASWCYCDVVNFGSFNLLWAKHFNSKTMKKENLLVNHAMIKKEDFEAVDGFSITGKGIYEDWILWLKLLAKGYFPIHMSYYGFWYRKTKNESNLKLAQENHQKNKELIKEYSKNVSDKVEPIEFPRLNESESADSKVIEPHIKNDKTNILLVVPYMKKDEDILEFVNNIDSKYQVTIISTRPFDYDVRQQYEKNNCLVFDLTTFLDLNNWEQFVNYLIKTRDIKLVINIDKNIEFKSSNIDIIDDEEFMKNKNFLNTIKDKDSKEKNISLVFDEDFYLDFEKACVNYRNEARDNDPQSLGLKIKRWPKDKKKKLAEELWKKPGYRKFVKTIKGEK